jgi:hypothetical protein
MTNNVVPFGKYRGQPVEALAADRRHLVRGEGSDVARRHYAVTA